MQYNVETLEAAKRSFYELGRHMFMDSYFGIRCDFCGKTKYLEGEYLLKKLDDESYKCGDCIARENREKMKRRLHLTKHTCIETKAIPEKIETKAIPEKIETNVIPEKIETKTKTEDVEIFVCASRKNLNSMTKLKLPSNRKVITAEASGFDDNIDQLNPWYCEASVLYTLWKNSKADIIGLEHYRRFFFYKDKILDDETIKTILKSNDMICCHIGMRPNVATRMNMLIGFPYTENHRARIKNDVFSFLKFIEKDESYRETAMFMRNDIKTRSRIIKGNIFIAKRETIAPYFEMMFNKLDEFIKLGGIKLTKNNVRNIGWFFELLFDSWCVSKKLRTYEMDIVQYDKNIIKREHIFRGKNTRETINKTFKKIEPIKKNSLKTIMTTNYTTKYSVLTYNFGHYDLPRKPKEINPNVSYIFVSDANNVPSPFVLKRDTKEKTSWLNTIKVKTHPFDYVDTDWVVVMDSSIEIVHDISPIIEFCEKNEIEALFISSPYNINWMAEIDQLHWKKRNPKINIEREWLDKNFKDRRLNIESMFYVLKRTDLTIKLFEEITKRNEELAKLGSPPRPSQVIYSAVIANEFADYVKSGKISFMSSWQIRGAGSLMRVFQHGKISPNQPLKCRDEVDIIGSNTKLYEFRDLDNKYTNNTKHM